MGVGGVTEFRAIDVITHKIICEFNESLGFALIATEDSLVLRQALKNVVKQFTSHKIYDQRLTLKIAEFQQTMLPTLNAIVEDVFFFYPRILNRRDFNPW